MKVLIISNPIINSMDFIDESIQQETLSSGMDSVQLVSGTTIRMIRSKLSFENFKFVEFVPQTIFITSELFWDNDITFEGYYVARELITHIYKSEYIQLVFLSVLDKITLLKLVETRDRVFVETFPHVCLLNEKFEIRSTYYSKIQYRLIKQLALSDSNRLQKISHDMNSATANLSSSDLSIEQKRNGFIRLVEELELFQAWCPSGINLAEIIRKIKGAGDNSELKSLASEVNIIISEASFRLPKGNPDMIPDIKKKRNQKILIVEDEDTYRNFLHEILSAHYKHVYPDPNNNYLCDDNMESFKIREAKEIIASQAKKYDIFFLDLLFKDQDGNWFDFNGLDLYQLIRRKNPYAVIRIITGLPRGVVARVVESILIDSEKPNTDQIFTKKYGFEALRDFVFESINVINDEYVRKRKLKTAWSPFPKTGFFGGDNIRNLVYDLMFVQYSEFEAKKQQAFELFRMYLNNKLNKNTSNWGNGTLPSHQMKYDCSEDFFKRSLLNILVHRLIAINEALKNESNRIFFRDHKILLGKICNNIPSKDYFRKLSFNGSDYIKEADKDSHYFQIQFINLFPHETNFIQEKLKESSQVDENELLSCHNTYIYEWFKNFLSQDLKIYEVWDELHLDFNPYSNQMQSIEETGNIDKIQLPHNLTIKNIRDFLLSLYLNYHLVTVPQIVEFITDNPINEDQITDKLIGNLINQLYIKDPDDVSDLLV